MVTNINLPTVPDRSLYQQSRDWQWEVHVLVHSKVIDVLFKTRHYAVLTPWNLTNVSPVSNGPITQIIALLKLMTGRMYQYTMLHSVIFKKKVIGGVFLKESINFMDLYQRNSMVGFDSGFQQITASNHRYNSRWGIYLVRMTNYIKKIYRKHLPNVHCVTVLSFITSL